MNIRPVTVADLPAVLALNKESLPHVGDIDLAQLQWFVDNAAYFKVGMLDDQLAGFLIALTPEADYGSPNFRWFTARYTAFMYIDRIAIRDRFQGRGLGRCFYRDLEAESEGRVPLLSCEVNTRPPNPQSMAFHEKLGFETVGQQDTESDKKRVALMIKRLDCDGLRSGRA